MAAGIYDYYKEGGYKNTDGAWNVFKYGIRDADVGIWRILFNASVFAAGIALLAAIALLAISAGGGRSAKDFQEAKRWLVRIIVVSILIFAVTGLISLVGGMGLG